MWRSLPFFARLILVLGTHFFYLPKCWFEGLFLTRYTMLFIVGCHGGGESSHVGAALCCSHRQEFTTAVWGTGGAGA
jgi:hypothetical protein